MEHQRSMCKSFLPFAVKKRFHKSQSKKHGLSDQQFKELKLAFRSFDQNNDGYIDIEEVTLLMNQIGANLTADEVKDIMKDGQKNNKLSLSDFIQVMTSTKEDNIDSGTKIGILESEIQQAFDQLDKNDDGYISQEELKILSKQVLGLHFNDDDILRMMEEADLNGDGLVDYQEFKTAIFKQKEN